MSHILIQKLSVNYKALGVLENICFEAQKGEFITIVGKSGCGKTTFLHALAGFIPYAGQMKIDGKIGMVFQQHAVFPWMTVEGNIGFGVERVGKLNYALPEGDNGHCRLPKVFGYNKLKKQEIVLEYLKLAGLEDKRDKYPAELSGGQIQRVALARSLAHNPDILLMDEPYGALDAYTRNKMQQWLLEVWEKHKKTIIFVTHDIEEAIFLADKVLILNNGKFSYEFKIPFRRPRSEEVKFSEEFVRLKREVGGGIR